jgi:acyl-CoA synthetase (AMP-forming)/AMP-acid ligase II
MIDDGFITIVGRIKELIIAGGFNVYPSEVEDPYARCPGSQSGSGGPALGARR